VGNIKPKLDAEAQQIVESVRQGADIHEAIAKHASALGYNDHTVRSLTQLVNRHAFKKAMELDKCDEFPPAYAERVLLAMHGEKQAVKAASASPGLAVRTTLGSGSGYSSARPGGIAFDDTPALLQKLAARRSQLDSQIKVAMAEIRDLLATMESRVARAKELGIEKLGVYQQQFETLSPFERQLVDRVFEATAIEKHAFTRGQLRILVPETQRHATDLVELAKTAAARMAAVIDLRARRRNVRDHLVQLQEG